MKLRKFRTFLALLMPFLLICYLTVWAVSNESNHIYYFKIDIPKAFNPNFTDAELWEYVESGNSIPISEFKKRNLPIPNDDGFLHIKLKKDRRLEIYLQDFGNLDDTTPLTQKLTEVFQEREQNGVFEVTSNKIVKAVIVKAPRSAIYGDVVKVIDAVKSSGADPIILQIDGLPE